MWFYKRLGRGIVSWLSAKLPADDIPICDFDALKHEVRSGDVLLVEGRTRISSIIKHLTTSHWSHSALYIGRLHNVEDPEMRRWIKAHIDTADSTQLVIEGVLGKGIIISKLSAYEGEHVRICRPKGLSHQDSQVVLGHAIQSVGKTYHVRHIFDLARFLLPWTILPRRWGSCLFKPNNKHDRKEICSSLIAEAFQQVNFPVLPVISDNENGDVTFAHRNSRMYVPSDFDYSPYFEIIKYPMMNTGQAPAYRTLPWEAE